MEVNWLIPVVLFSFFLLNDVLGTTGKSLHMRKVWLRNARGKSGVCLSSGLLREFRHIALPLFLLFLFGIFHAFSGSRTLAVCVCMVILNIVFLYKWAEDLHFQRKQLCWRRYVSTFTYENWRKWKSVIFSECLHFVPSYLLQPSCSI